MNPHMFMLMRARATPMLSASQNIVRATQATRGGGGGSWHRPDPKPYALHKYTKRYRLEDINTVWYGDFGPEFWVHLHSIQIQHSKQGIALVCAMFFVVVLPLWLTLR